MNVVSETAGYLLIVSFGLAMIALTWLASRNPRWVSTQAGFLVAGRDVHWLLAAPSIAASWIWAPALFVSVQKAYELGIPGIFWFTAPNILALVVFAWLAPKIRAKIPGGYTLPDWIRHRFADQRLHRIYLIPYIWYQIMAVTVQIFVGGLMLNFLTGVPLNIGMILLLLVGLSYSLISGLRASIVTDVLQMAFILVGVLVIIPWIISIAGWEAIAKGAGGLAGNRNIFDPQVAFSFGIVTSIGLIAGSISDQQYWQRSFATKREHLSKAFVVGGILFGIVPIALSVLGFLAANPDLGIALPAGTGLPMIGVATVVKLLPLWASLLFVVILLSGLESTLDSALCAASSLYAIDMAPLTADQRELLRKERLLEPFSEEDKRAKEELDSLTIKRSRIAMYGISLLGLVTALIVQHLFPLDRLWWIFNGVASCFAVPTVLSVYWGRLSSRGAFWGIVLSLLGMVPFVYGNWVQNDVITVLSAVAIIGLNLIVCLVMRRETPWKEGESQEV
jgi:urea-proton symporter